MKLNGERESDDEGRVRCGLCGQMDFPVTDHGDCRLCATDQYA